MKQVTTTLYDFDELTDEAKDTAREWYRNGALDYNWWDFIYEDAARAGITIAGCDTYHGTISGKIPDPHETIRTILRDHGPTCETYKTACAALRDYARRQWRWYMQAREEEPGYFIPTDYYFIPTDYVYTEDYEDWSADVTNSLLEDYRIILQREEEYLLSDESVDESIRVNEYTFTESGRRHD